MATIALYKSGFNQMPGLIKEVKDSVTDFKAELLALQTKAISIKKSVCDLDNIIDSLQVSTQIQDEKLMSLESFEQNCEEFISEVIHIDSEVADIVKLRKEEFYGAYSYLKPEIEKDWKEKAADWFESVGDWCKEHWKELLITVVIVIGAVLAIAAVICSGGLALVPMLTALLTTLGVSAAMATTIATVASLTIAGIAIVSTLGSSALNIVDTWCDMSENSTFKSWQTAMNWISIISNGLYSIGAIYNSLTAKLANVGKGGSVPKGTLTGKLDGLTTAERTMVDDLLNAGNNVEIIPRSNIPGNKTPDFLVNGVKTELKTLTGTSLNTPVTRIQDGFKQGAEAVIIDGRNTGLTLNDANTVIERVLGKYGGELPGIVEIWITEGIIRR